MVRNAPPPLHQNRNGAETVAGSAGCPRSGHPPKTVLSRPFLHASTFGISPNSPHKPREKTTPNKNQTPHPPPTPLGGPPEADAHRSRSRSPTSKASAQRSCSSPMALPRLPLAERQALHLLISSTAFTTATLTWMGRWEAANGHVGGTWAISPLGDLYIYIYIYTFGGGIKKKEETQVPDLETGDAQCERRKLVTGSGCGKEL